MRERQWRTHLIDAVLNDLPPGGVLLDPAGCGTGRNAIAIAIVRARPDVHVIGVDGDPAALAIARGKCGAEQVTWGTQLVTDFERPGDCDVVLCSLLLHHISDPQKRDALERAASVLTRAGALHIADWGPPAGPMTRMGSRALKSLDGTSGPARLLEGHLTREFAASGFAPSSPHRTVATVWGSLDLWRVPAAALLA